jgi:hypothetical protein
MGLGVAAVVITAVGLPASADVIPHNFVQVASGKVAGQTWKLGMARGPNHTRCFKLTTHSGGVATCERDDLEGEWHQVTGTDVLSASMELELTSSRVSRLKLFLRHPRESGPSARPGTWRSITPRRLTTKQARETHLSRNFRFAVVTERGNLCVEKVRAFDHKGRLLEKLSLPCEY